MSPDTLLASLELLGWSERFLARRLGISQRQVRRWLAPPGTPGAAKVPPNVAAWIKTLVAPVHKHPLPPGWVA